MHLCFFGQMTVYVCRLIPVGLQLCGHMTLLWHNQVRLTRSPRLPMHARMCYIMSAECKVFPCRSFYGCFHSFLWLLFHDDVLLVLELWDSFGFGVRLGRGICGVTDCELTLCIPNNCKLQSGFFQSEVCIFCAFAY